MTVEQLTYANCEKGLYGHPGLQPQAKSPGLDAADMSELIGSVGYRPPEGLPANPDEADIRRWCPPALYVRLLKSGRLAATRSVYTGMTYDNRPGDFVSHAVVFDPPEVDPVALLNWPGWHGVREVEPPRLETLDGASFAGGAGGDGVRAAVRGRPGGQALLAAMIDRVLTDRQVPVPPGLAIVGEAGDLGPWSAAVMSAIGRCGGKPLSFTTYVHVPRGGQLPIDIDVCGVLRESLDRLGPSSRPQVDVGAAAPPAAPRYAQLLADEWLAPDAAVSAGFGRFCAGFELTPDATQLAAVARWWDLAAGGTAPGGQAAIGQLLAFVAARLRLASTAAARLRVALGRLAKSLPPAVPLEPAWAASLAEVARRAADPALSRDMTDWLHRSQWAGVSAGQAWEPLAEAVRAVAAGPADDATKAAYKRLAGESLAGLATSALARAETAAAALDAILNQLDSAGVDPWADRAFVDDCLAVATSVPALRAALTVQLANGLGVDRFAALLAPLISKLRTATVVEMMSAIAADAQGSVMADPLRQKLEAAGFGAVVEAERVARVGRATSDQLVDMALDPKTGDKELAQVVKRLADLDDPGLRVAAGKLLGDPAAFGRLPQALGNRAVQLVDADLPVDGTADSQLMASLARLPAARQSALRRFPLNRELAAIGRKSAGQLASQDWVTLIVESGLTAEGRELVSLHVFSRTIATCRKLDQLITAIIVCKKFVRPKQSAVTLGKAVGQLGSSRRSSRPIAVLTLLWVADQTRKGRDNPWPPEVGAELNRVVPRWLASCDRVMWELVCRRLDTYYRKTPNTKAWLKTWSRKASEISAKRGSTFRRLVNAVALPGRLARRLFGGRGEAKGNHG